jgi:hypothetical protein
MKNSTRQKADNWPEFGYGVCSRVHQNAGAGRLSAGPLRVLREPFSDRHVPLVFGDGVGLYVQVRAAAGK